VTRISQSPTIDAGISDPANGPTDLDGIRRDDGSQVYFVCGAGVNPPQTDIGAYEELQAVPTIAPSCRPPARPDTRITAARIRKDVGRAKFRFKATGPATGFQCKLVRGRPKPGKRRRPKPFRACSSPKAYRKLKSGRYRFLVRAENAGAVDSTPATRRFRIP